MDMGAPIANEFWKLRKKSGRDKIFESPENLLKACTEYFEEITKITLNEQDWVGKDGREVEKKHPIAFTISGLCTFLGITLQTWENYKKLDSHKEFFDIVLRVEQIIWTQKFSYAAAGLLNPNIISRELGLADKKDLTSSDGSATPKITLQYQGKEISLKDE